MKSSNRISPSMLIQLIVLVLIAIIGILYILDEAPVDSVKRYDKQPVVTPFGSASDNNYFRPKRDDDSGGDDVSLSGKKGRYDEALIGK
ncbi:MAG: hypothetical protein ACN4GM_11420 [Gammaproteobacteria bacterium]